MFSRHILTSNAYLGRVKHGKWLTTKFGQERTSIVNTNPDANNFFTLESLYIGQFGDIACSACYRLSVCLCVSDKVFTELFGVWGIFRTILADSGSI